jgi:SH3-like domain-containing protein
MLLRAVFAVFFALAAAFAETAVLAQDNPSGLPLPRFATTRSSPINVRVGPGTRYDVAWVYVKPGTPVEIIQEFDTWRKIRDFDGSEGWVHQNLLSGNRAGIVAPWRQGEQLPLFSGKSEDGGVRAYLPAGFQVGITACDKAWCTVSATDHPEGGGQHIYDGFLPQDELWGVYRDEEFD